MCYLSFIFTVIGTNLLVEFNKNKNKKKILLSIVYQTTFHKCFFLTIATKTVTEQAKLRKIN